MENVSQFERHRPRNAPTDFVTVNGDHRHDERRGAGDEGLARPQRFVKTEFAFLEALRPCAAMMSISVVRVMPRKIE